MPVMTRVTICLLLAVLAVDGRSRTALAQAATDSATRQYNSAVDLQNRGQFEAAIKEWVTFIDTYKSDIRGDRAYHYLGVCYLKTDKPDLARQCFEIVVKHFPKCELSDATYYCLGSALYSLAQAGKAEMYSTAAEAFNAVIVKYPNSQYVAQAVFNRGECFYHQGNKQRAAEMYAQLLAKYPSDDLTVHALYALGVSQEELGQYADAGTNYDLFLKKHPQHALAAEITVRRGETLLALGQFELAAERFAAAAAMPGFAMADHATMRHAEALIRLKKYAEAGDAYASLSGKWPRSKLLGVANLAGGKCYYLAGRFADARKMLEAAVAAGGDSLGEAAHWLVRSTLKEGKPAEAATLAESMLAKLGDVSQAAQLMMDRADAIYEVPARRGESIGLYAALAAKYPKEPVAPQALYMAGFVALGNGDYQSALKHAAAFLAAYPTNDLVADAAYVAAESHLQLRQYAEAEKGFASLLQAFPDHADAEAWRVRRGLSLQLQKKHAETIALLRPLLDELRTPEALAEAQYLLGASQAEMKQWDAAATSLEASLAVQPKWRQADEALLLLGQAYSELHQSDKAKAAIARLLADFPKSSILDRAHYRLGELDYAGGDFDAATAEYQQVIDRWPQSPLAAQAHYGLGWAKIGQGDYAAAEKGFEAMLRTHPDHKLVPRVRYARAIARHQLKNYAAAIEDIEASLAADPTRAEKSDAHYLLGLCQAGLQQQSEAVATFQAILSNDPKYVGADKVLYELAWALKHQDKEKEAVAVFVRLAGEYAASPLAAEAQYRVGEAAYNSSDYKSAVVAYRAAMKLAGATELGEKAAHKLGWSYFRLDDFANAQQTFNRQRAAWPQGPLAADAAFMEGESLLKQKKFAEALAAYRQVTEPTGKDFKVLALLHAGQAAGELKQWEKSLELLAKCIEEFPQSVCWPEALCEQAWAKQNLGKLDEAVALYRQVIAKTGSEAAARAQFMIGQIQFEQKKYREAASSYVKVSYGYSYPQWQAAATFEAGRCFEAEGKTEQAIKQYREVIVKYPQSDKVLPAKQRIQELKK